MNGEGGKMDGGSSRRSPRREPPPEPRAPESQPPPPTSHTASSSETDHPSQPPPTEPHAPPHADSTTAAAESSHLLARLRRPLRGEVGARSLVLETLRRAGVAVALRRERAELARGGACEPAPRLRADFAALTPSGRLAHFRARAEPSLPPGLNAPHAEIARLSRELFPRETEELIASARAVAGPGRWALLGCGEFDFGAEVDWLRDPLSGARWPADFHADIALARSDGSDVRVLWELNRLGHLVTLAQAYAVTSDESFAETFFAHVEGWRAQNPVGRGPNWASAMEPALRAVNLLAAFHLFRRSPLLDARRLDLLLATLDEHGRHVRAHLEFSHIATSNHYLANVAGLLWLGVLLPELDAARAWREFALRELQREMDKQVLADGADYESSTGYHRLACEIFLYTFLLCHANGIEIEERHWLRLRSMLAYVRAYLRPDGRAPLIGDTDGGRFLPLSPRRAADDHAYLTCVGASVFNEPRLKLTDEPPVELLWLLGDEGLRDYAQLPRDEAPASAGYSRAGTFVLRDGDLYLLLSASGAGLRGRGSHAHNDALSVEVSACGVPFVADPGTYVYTANLRERHLFRSTAYHSTVEVDGAEQNETDESAPFRIGDDARPRALSWLTTEERDAVSAEHRGYARLPAPVTHRRAAALDKRRRLFLVEDSLEGSGTHVFRFRFHAARGITVRVRDRAAELYDEATGARLFIVPVGVESPPEIEPRWTSRDYGERAPSQSACWAVRATAPLEVVWALVPVSAGEDVGARLGLAQELRAAGRENWPNS